MYREKWDKLLLSSWLFLSSITSQQCQVKNYLVLQCKYQINLQLKICLVKIIRNYIKCIIKRS